MDPHRPLEGLDDSPEQQKRPLDHGSSFQVGVGGEKIGVGIGVGREEELEDHGPSEQEGMKREEDQSDESGYKDNASEDTVATRSASAAKDTVIIEVEDDESPAGPHKTAVKSVSKRKLRGPVGKALDPGWGQVRWGTVMENPSSVPESNSDLGRGGGRGA